jgi:hypothetical protein
LMLRQILQRYIFLGTQKDEHLAATGKFWLAFNFHWKLGTDFHSSLSLGGTQHGEKYDLHTYGSGIHSACLLAHNDRTVT